LIVLAGQSNMVGLGPLSRPTPRHSRVYLFGNDYRWHTAREPLDDNQDQVDRVSEDEGTGVGPGLAFALAMRDRDPSLAIGLIPCAKGGSAIVEWQRDLSDTSLYGSCLKRLRAASTMGEPAGMLFHQGETDAEGQGPWREIERSPTSWAAQFAAFVHAFREDVGRPELAVVFAQLGSHTALERFVYWEEVQAQQQSVQIPNSAMIATHDVPLQDYVHFTSDGYRDIGVRFADAFWNVVRPLAP